MQPRKKGISFKTIMKNTTLSDIFKKKDKKEADDNEGE